jgi:hypothetical protein
MCNYASYRSLTGNLFQYCVDIGRNTTCPLYAKIVSIATFPGPSADFKMTMQRPRTEKFTHLRRKKSRLIAVASLFGVSRKRCSDLACGNNCTSIQTAN